MPTFGAIEWLCVAILAFSFLYPLWYFATGQLQKDIIKLRKLWRSTDPNDNPIDRP